MGLPGIEHINSLLAVQGLIRDLNHHIPHLRQMARLSFSQWKCSFSQCRDPLSRIDHKLPAISNDITNKVPSPWYIAQQTVGMRVDLIDTEQSLVRKGEVSFPHLFASDKLITKGARDKLLRAFKYTSNGITWLSDKATWSALDCAEKRDAIAWSFV